MWSYPEKKVICYSRLAHAMSCRISAFDACHELVEVGYDVPAIGFAQ